MRQIEKVKELEQRIIELEKQVELLKSGKAEKGHAHPHYIPLSERRF